MKFYWPLVQFLRARVNWPSETRVKCEIGKLKRESRLGVPRIRKGGREQAAGNVRPFHPSKEKLGAPSENQMRSEDHLSNGFARSVT
jgi:hypothetical protein